jgi:peptide/nickel transport system ATP-binding protein
MDGARANGAVLEVRDLSVEFSDGTVSIPAISGLSFELRANEILGLFGETGSGKSVLAKAIIDLVPYPGKTTRGEVWLHGQPLPHANPRAMRAIHGGKIAYIGTNPKSLLNPVERVGNQIAAVLRAHRDISRRQAWEATIQLLADVGIAEPERRVRSYPHELSGGMAQRVVIAMALVADPDVVLADDATLGLDATVQMQVLDLLVEQCRKRGLAVLLITHDLGIVAQYCQRVAIIRNGRIIELSSVEQFLSGPADSYSRELLDAVEAVPRAGMSVRPQPAASCAAAPLLEVERLVKHFPIRGTDQVVRAVDGVSFTIAHGETLALVGESGSGKTTVGMCLVRLMCEGAGTIRFTGQVISGLGDRAFRDFRRRMQMVFQEPYLALNPRWRIRDLIAEPLGLIPEIIDEERDERVRELLGMVHLSVELSKRYPHQLTAGEQKRVGIARALATRPDFVVFDEPTTALDIRVRAQIIALIRELQERTGLTALFITHDLNSVRHVAHRVAVMRAGKIVELGDTEKIFARPQEAYTKTLLAAELPIRRSPRLALAAG